MPSPTFLVSIDEVKAVGHDVDAEHIQSLLNECVELSWELANRNHSRGTDAIYRIIDNLIDLATSELSLDVRWE